MLTANPAKTVSAQAVLVLRTLADLTEADHGRPPTLREMRRVLGWASTNAVGEHYDDLERALLIVREPKRARSVRLTDKGRALLATRPWVRIVEPGPPPPPPAPRGIYEAEGVRAVARVLSVDTGNGVLYRVEIDAEHVRALDDAAVSLRLVVAADGEVTDAEGEQYEAGVDGWTPLGAEAFDAAADSEIAAAIACALDAAAVQRAA